LTLGVLIITGYKVAKNVVCQIKFQQFIG
jgi:hypothetical protein